MTDREKVRWLSLLLSIWGSALVPLLVFVVTEPTSVDAAKAMLAGALIFVAICTATYLLILSWRAAYLSGRKKR